MSTRYRLGDHWHTADAIADHKQTSHHLNACLWGLRDAFKACKETRS